MSLTWGIIGLIIAIAVIVWLYVNTVRGHSRMASNVSVKPRTRDRWDAAHPDRPRRMGEQVRDTQARTSKR